MPLLREVCSRSARKEGIREDTAQRGSSRLSGGEIKTARSMTLRNSRTLPGQE